MIENFKSRKASALSHGSLRGGGGGGVGPLQFRYSGRFTASGGGQERRF